LCYSCYKTENNPQKATTTAEFPEEKNYFNGLSEKDRNYRYNMIKAELQKL
jgi:hypothetical protein